jgi:hypothetical protein
MAHRTSKPLHPTEFGDPEVLSTKTNLKSKPKKKGYKTSGLTESVTKTPITNRPESTFRSTTSVTKKKGLSSKKMKSKTKYVAAISKKVKADDPNVKVTYTTTKTKGGHVKKYKEISKKKYLRKKARLKKTHERFGGS